ncbi:MAG: hypothetical protein ACJ790_07815 [Myxococcaceae bacterium]
MSELTEALHQGFRKITLANEHLEVSVLPELGGKLIALRRPGGPNVLLEPPDFPYRAANLNDSFELYDTSGFDECFPTVAACPDPDEKGAALPDHGELWSAAFRDEWLPHTESLRTSVNGKLWSFTFSRELRLIGDALRLDYTVRSSVRRHFLWSAHPLLKVSEGSKIFLPTEVKSLVVESSRGNRLGKKGDRVSWNEPLATVGPPSLGFAEKLFTDAVTDGWCAFWDAASNQTIEFRFDVKKTPYVGLWISQGGWPESRPSKHFTAALEPCTGRPDALDQAVMRGEARVTTEDTPEQWWLEIRVRQGKPNGPALEKRSP